MNAYYNENDEFAAAWLRNIIAAGYVSPGDVDTRSIVDVRVDDLAGYSQCHFFAGIGGWPYALRLAGWPDERAVWTGSCPCGPFSGAGKKLAFDDPRHLWPEFFRLIAQRMPCIVFGEQVASPSGLAWVDLVQSDMETKNYAFAAFDLCAASIGAPHIRQRLYWVADAYDAGLERRFGLSERAGECAVGPDRLVDRLADSDGGHSSAEGLQRGRQQRQLAQDGGAGHNSRGGPLDGHWRDADWLFCRDGKWRPVEPGTFPLAHGATARVGRLRGYGNAIVAPLAQAFIEAVMEVIP